MSLEESRLIQGAIKITAELVSRFFLTRVFLFPEGKKMVVICSSGQNDIISLFERLKKESGIELKLEIQDEKWIEAQHNEHAKSAIILYGKEKQASGKKAFSEKIILEFDTSALQNKDKIRLYQKLYGYEKKGRKRKVKKQDGQEKFASKMVQHIEKYGMEKYGEKYVYEGFLQKISGEKIGKSAIMFDAIHKGAAEQFFSYFNVRHTMRIVFIE